MKNEKKKTYEAYRTLLWVLQELFCRLRLGATGGGINDENFERDDPLINEGKQKSWTSFDR